MARENGRSVMVMHQRAMRTESRLTRRLRRFAENKSANPSFRPASAKDRINGKKVIDEALSLLKPRPATAKHKRNTIDAMQSLGNKMRSARHRQHIRSSKYFLQQRARKEKEKEKEMERLMRREQWKRHTTCERQITQLNRWASGSDPDGGALDPALRNKKFVLEDQSPELDFTNVPRGERPNYEKEPTVRVTTIGDDGAVKYERFLDVEEISKIYHKHKALMESKTQEMQAKRTYMELCATTSEDVQANLESLLKAATERTDELQRQMNYISTCGWNL